MAEIRREMNVDRQAELWCAFVDSYSATETRPVVDVFLRALIGEPRRREDAA